MKQTKAKFRRNDVVMHEEQKVTLIVDGKDYIADRGWLYTLRVVSDDNNAEYKRYYEDKLVDKCNKVKNAKAFKVLYGKK